MKLHRARERDAIDGKLRLDERRRALEVTPTWAKLIDFETILRSAVEELTRQRDEPSAQLSTTTTIERLTGVSNRDPAWHRDALVRRFPMALADCTIATRYDTSERRREAGGLDTRAGRRTRERGPLAGPSLQSDRT